MTVYWMNRAGTGPADIVKEINKDKAEQWAKTEPQSHISIGNGRVFINPPDYHISGYSLTTEDLEDLLKKVRERS